MHARGAKAAYHSDASRRMQALFTPDSADEEVSLPP